jgi:hypothetical protein
MGKTHTKRRHHYFGRKHHSGAHHMTIPLAVVAGFAAPMGRTIDGFKNGGGIRGGVTALSNCMLGIDPYAARIEWHPGLMQNGAFPVLLGLSVHWMAGRLGVNRMLARSGIPLIRI